VSARSPKLARQIPVGVNRASPIRAVPDSRDHVQRFPHMPARLNSPSTMRKRPSDCLRAGSGSSWISWRLKSTRRSPCTTRPGTTPTRSLNRIKPVL